MTKLWFKHAIRDLKTAKALLGMGPEFKHSAAYHAQQCAEKASKGYLTFTKCRVVKTHDFKALAEIAETVDKAFSEYILKFRSLSNLAVIYRYPDAEVKPLTVAAAKSAVKKAEKVYHDCFNKVYRQMGDDLPDKAKWVANFM